ncbi:hypothetical protein [Devosia sp. 919]|uniref:hypothetical protein n=1 Tax=Devosia sp. 919 TaxID=2726065 RepID=UPI0015557B8F|nr:hypothetical protein [Devosia sp. 919]
MTIEIFGRKMKRDTVEALIEEMIAALNAADGEPDSEPETDEDDLRWCPKRLPKAA